MGFGSKGDFSSYGRKGETRTRGVRVPDSRNWYVADHFLNVGTQNEFLAVSNNGASSGVSIVGVAGRMGVAELTTGTLATGRAALQTAATAIRGPTAGDIQRFKAMGLTVPTLSGAVDTHVYRAGFQDSVAAASTDGAYVELDTNTDAQLQCVTANGGVRTTVDSGVTISAGEEHDVEIELTSSRAVFTITEVATGAVTQVAITTNLPADTVAYGVMVTIQKSLGTTAHTLRVDSVEFEGTQP